MRLTRFILALAFLAVVGLTSGAFQPAKAACTQGQITAGTCDPSNVNDDDVSLEGDGSTDNSGGGGGSSGGGGEGSGGSGTGVSGGDPEAPDCDMRECFDVVDPEDPVRRVTWSDIARFRPTPEVDHMEPNGWMVVGLETNFYATGGVRVVPGELLGSAAAVRFTPVRWNWSYGDGTRSTENVRGAPWRSTGDREFDETATSHVYQQAGTYVIDLLVDYTAEYQFAGGPWVSIDGVLSVQTNRLRATAGSAQTLLFEQDCRENPRGAGC